MDNKQIVNQRQLAWITASLITSGGIISLQNALIRVTEMDAWFCYLLPVLYIFVSASFFYAMAKLFPGKHIFEISKLLLGTIGGTIANIVFMFHLWMIVVRDISAISRFSATILLDNTPLDILALLPCLLLIYYGKSSFEIIARVNDIFYPLFVVSLILMPFMLSNEFAYQLIQPVLTTTPWQLTSGNMLALGSAGDIFVIGAFMHTLFGPRQIRSSVRHGVLLGVMLLSLITLLVLVVLGSKMPGNFVYPTYNLVQMIHITDFLDRVDIIMLTIWFPTVACKVVAVFMALLIGISNLLKNNDHTLFNKPVSLLIAIATLMSYKSTTELFAFSNFSSPVIVLGYQPLMMLLLYMAAIFYRKKRTDSQNHDTVQEQVGRSGPFTYQGWGRLSNLMVLVSVLSLIAGIMLGKYMPVIGNISAFVYALCLVLTTLSTYKEIKSIKPVKNIKKKESF